MKNIFIAFLIFLSGFHHLKAQQPVFIPYPSEKYPPASDNITSLFTNGHDFIWMAAGSSMLRFDGMNFESFLMNNSKNLTSIEQDSAGKLWVASDSNLFHFDRLKNQFSRESSRTFSHQVNDMLSDGERLWVATAGGGLYIKTKNQWEAITAANGLSDNYVYCLEKDKNGNIWAGTDQGISVISQRKPFRVLKKISEKEALPDLIVRRLKNSDDGRMWIGMQNSGIAVAEIRSGIRHVTPEWKYGEVNDIVIDNSDAWIATEKGGMVLVSDSDRPSVSFTQSESQSFNHITALAKTADGFLWFVSGGRLFKTAGMKWTWIKNLNTIKLKNIHTVFADSQNNLWFTPDSGLMILNADHSLHYYFLPGISKTTDITCFYEDNCQNVWIGTMGSGLYRFYKRTRQIQKIGVYQKDAEFQNILSLKGNNNTLWVATFGGVFKTSTGNCQDEKVQLTIEPIQTGQRIGNFYVYHVFVDSKGKTWFATDGNGLICYDDGKITPFEVSRFSKENVVYSIAEDKKGNLWFSVHEGGLIRFDGKQFRQFTMNDGLKSNAVQSVIHDGKNRLVLTYENGLDFFNTETGFIYGPGKEFGFENINPDLNAVSLDGGKNIWIGTSVGIIRLSSGYSVDSVRPYAMLCHAGIPGTTNFFANGESLRYSENLISLQFCGFWNGAPEQLLYRYKLNNSNAWINTADRQIVLSGLNPGKYEVVFQASHHPSFLFPAESTFQFTILKPFWKRTWFLALTAVMVAAFIFAFIRLRENQLRKLELLEKEKTIFQYETLKSQVNPHFLFNSLNTLISVIETESKEEAAQFAQQLSDFFRSSLSLREKDVISLKEETEMVQAFIQILVKRFGSRIKINSAIHRTDLEKKILPMSLQMLIENALKHNAATDEFPLQINIRTDGYYAYVSNNIRPKKNPETSTQTGLQNIINRYRHFGSEDVEVINDGKMFTVKLPLLNGKS